MNPVPGGNRPVLVTAADDDYAMPLAVMLRSALAHLRAAEGLDVTVMDGGIRPRNRRRIFAALPADNTTLRCVRPPHDRLRGLPVSGHIRISTYYKLLAAEMLPSTVGRAIFLDADIVVQGDLGELWRVDLDGRPLAAVQESGLTVDSPHGVKRYRELGLPAGAPYLNAGVLLMDLAAWRKEQIANAVFKYLREYRADVVFHDQDGINAVLANRWKPLERRWNYRVDCAQPARGKAEDWMAVLERDAAVVHFASSLKPWHFYAEHPARALFFRYLAETAWKEWRPRPPWRDVIFNRHTYGKLLRQTPLAGACWSAWRARRRPGR